MHFPKTLCWTTRSVSITPNVEKQQKQRTRQKKNQSHQTRRAWTCTRTGGCHQRQEEWGKGLTVGRAPGQPPRRQRRLSGQRGRRGRWEHGGGRSGQRGKKEMSACSQTSVSDEGEEEEEEKQKRDASATRRDQAALHSQPATSNYVEVTTTLYIFGPLLWTWVILL